MCLRTIKPHKSWQEFMPATQTFLGARAQCISEPQVTANIASHHRASHAIACGGRGISIYTQHTLLLGAVRAHLQQCGCATLFKFGSSHVSGQRGKFCSAARVEVVLFELASLWCCGRYLRWALGFRCSGVVWLTRPRAIVVCISSWTAWCACTL